MLKVSIITICRNEISKVKETIESVCNQSYLNIEYLIIDGASTDGTVKMLQGYSKKLQIRFYSEEDYGIYNAMNRGIARATGDYVIFMNAGDKFYDNYVIESMVSGIKDTNTIYYGKTCLVFPDGRKQIQDFFKEEGSVEEKLKKGSMPCHQAIFAPRKLLTDHYFREGYKIRADFEWLVYSVSKGHECKQIPVVVNYYDTGGISGRVKNAMLLRQEGDEIINEYRQAFEKNDLWEQKDIHKTSICKESCVIDKSLELKYQYMFQFMNHWMSVKQKGISLGNYLQKKGYRILAIYGLGSMGLRFVEELNGYGIQVKYAVDQSAHSLCADMPLILPEEALDEVELMVVTPITSFYEIEEKLRDRACFPIVSLEDIVYEAEAFEK